MANKIVSAYDATADFLYDMWEPVGEKLSDFSLILGETKDRALESVNLAWKLRHNRHLSKALAAATMASRKRLEQRLFVKLHQQNHEDITRIPISRAFFIWEKNDHPNAVHTTVTTVCVDLEQDRLYGTVEDYSRSKPDFYVLEGCTPRRLTLALFLETGQVDELVYDYGRNSTD